MCKGKNGMSTCWNGSSSQIFNRRSASISHSISRGGRAAAHARPVNAKPLADCGSFLVLLEYMISDTAQKLRREAAGPKHAAASPQLIASAACFGTALWARENRKLCFKLLP
jgi:hypothetical protein